MRAGKLDRTITIQRAVETVAPSGAVFSAWVDLADVRAELLQATADEVATGFGEAETVLRTFRIRWLANVEITTADRVFSAGAAYGIKDVVEIGRRRGLELRCERVRT
ncbi:MAG: head-tail adaptor protein [Mesorhizobium sp.]|uniref:head-tail adaptor protein n=1 Tax=Mesorhizobium sp. TaxID=1871066 RepID=UPI000FE5828B|nr:MAG: head-tail adaptor protein [Mesorhizobium sp.]RWE55783.1 MAG: head-tail adaptor protein [Mesorhizobium sp.]RWF07316.1 MAG: head-tail adaptor protein [Mesorhizobium sp.]RWF09688.1 MAG: head-tail adaptor protein [Mesorhizobium sp.]